MAIRDFTEEHRQYLITLAQEAQVEEGDWFGMFVDRFTDLFILDDLHSYNNDIAKYHRNVIDKFNTSETELRQIFQEVDSIDACYAGLLKVQIDELIQIAADVNKLSDMLDVSSGFPLIAQDSAFVADYIFKSFNSLANQQAYDRLLQERIYNLLENEFSEDAWNALQSDGERSIFLERLMTEIANIMGVEIIEGFIIEEMDVSGYLGLFSSSDLTVHLYPKLLKENNWSIISSALVHEVRHAYQLQATLDYEYHKEIELGSGPPSFRLSNEIVYSPTSDSQAHLFVSEETLDIWYQALQARYSTPDFDNPEEFKTYVERPREYDAWAFAGQLETELFKEIAPGVRKPDEFLDSLKPSHRGSW